MSNKHFNGEEPAEEKKEQHVKQEEATNLQEQGEKKTEESAENDNKADALADLQKFDNYRKRTLREKSELIKNGGEGALTHLLPVVDDFERALQNIEKAEDIAAMAEGVGLIYNKFVSYLNSQGVKAIEVVGKPFDIEQCEAIATIPAPEPEQKGKVIDCVQTGYTLNDKVIRHAKVVVGE